MNRYRIVYSSESTDLAQLGRAHYSYGFASRKFMKAFQVLGYEPERIELPAYYGGRGLSTVDGETTFHLIFRSAENIHTISGSYNICCFAWEFDVMKTETERFEHPFSNQKRMLEACQEIWVPCTFSQRVLSKFGIKNVHCISAPIEMPVNKNTQKLPVFFSLWKVQSVYAKFRHIPEQPTFSRHETLSLTERNCVIEAINANQLFLTLLNPHDERKNLQETIFGFLTLLQKYPHAVLIVKLVTAEEHVPLPEILDRVFFQFFDTGISVLCDRIVVISGYISDDELAALYRIADFYLCASTAEGQNLPLLEAMSYGVVPVSVVHTAMTDYLTDDNCIPITSRAFAYTRRQAAESTRKHYTIQFSTQTDVGRALVRACETPEAKLFQMRQNARDTVAQRFSPTVVAKLIGDRLAAITME